MPEPDDEEDDEEDDAALADALELEEDADPPPVDPGPPPVPPDPPVPALLAGPEVAWDPAGVVSTSPPQESAARQDIQSHGRRAFRFRMSRRLAHRGVPRG